MMRRALEESNMVMGIVVKYRAVHTAAIWHILAGLWYHDLPEIYQIKTDWGFTITNYNWFTINLPITNCKSPGFRCDLQLI